MQLQQMSVIGFGKRPVQVALSAAQAFKDTEADRIAATSASVQVRMDESRNLMMAFMALLSLSP